jgi:hypothetical protein
MSRLHDPPSRPVRRYRLGEEPKDCEYWLTLSMRQRLDALIDLIGEHDGWDDEAAPRLARVSRLVERRDDLGLPDKE